VANDGATHQMNKHTEYIVIEVPFYIPCWCPWHWEPEGEQLQELQQEPSDELQREAGTDEEAQQVLPLNLQTPALRDGLERLEDSMCRMQLAMRKLETRMENDLCLSTGGGLPSEGAHAQEPMEHMDRNEAIEEEVEVPSDEQGTRTHPQPQSTAATQADSAKERFGARHASHSIHGKRQKTFKCIWWYLMAEIVAIVVAAGSLTAYASYRGYRALRPTTMQLSYAYMDRLDVELQGLSNTLQRTPWTALLRAAAARGAFHDPSSMTSKKQAT